MTATVQVVWDILEGAGCIPRACMELDHRALYGCEGILRSRQRDMRRLEPVTNRWGMGMRGRGSIVEAWAPVTLALFLKPWHRFAH